MWICEGMDSKFQGLTPPPPAPSEYNVNGLLRGQGIAGWHPLPH